METSTDCELFATDSVNLAAYLVTCGHEIVHWDWENGPGCWMHFRQVEDLAVMAFGFIAGTAEVNASKYATTLAIVKRELHNSRPTGR